MRNSSERFEQAALYARFNKMSMKFLCGLELEIALVDRRTLLNCEDDSHRIGAAIE